MACHKQELICALTYLNLMIVYQLGMLWRVMEENGMCIKHLINMVKEMHSSHLKVESCFITSTVYVKLALTNWMRKYVTTTYCGSSSEDQTDMEYIKTCSEMDTRTCRRQYMLAGKYRKHLNTDGRINKII